jgi:general secretion pathway protein A
MSYSQFESRRDSPFTGVVGARSFFKSSHYREALATLYHGVETRKKLILCTGEAGTGKSTLLQQFALEQGANVNCVLISDPHLGFTEIIRSILGQLQVESASTAEPALLRQWLKVMRLECESGRIICLAFDDAHHLHDRVLEKILHEFIGVNPVDSQKHFAQVILAGRPKLKDRLFRPPLGSLGSLLLGSECRLAVLNDKEIGEYIEHQLRAADLPVDLFGHEAIQRIAVYSGGNLHHVNVLCDRLFQATGASLKRQISVAAIETAAQDLNLWQPRWTSMEKPTKDFTLPKERDEPFGFTLDDNDTTEAVGQTFMNYSDDSSPTQSLLSRNGHGRRISIWVILIALVGAGAWWQGNQVEDRRDSSDNNKKYEAVRSDYLPFSAPTNADRKTDSVAQELEPNTLPPDSKLSPPPPAGEAEDKNQVASLPETGKQSEPPTAAAPRQNPPIAKPDPAPKKVTPAVKQKGPESHPPASIENAEIRRKRLEIEVAKAIENRAIAGVAVAVIDEIIFLDGRVATERQRAAAELAARSVAGVEKVRNRIGVNVS